MYDATVKSGNGFEYGVQHQFGHFDECLQLNRNDVETLDATTVRAKYCLTAVSLNALTANEAAAITRNKKVNRLLQILKIC